MEIPRHWRLRQQRYGLVGEVCPHCNAKMFPPRDVCPGCGDGSPVEQQMQEGGIVAAATNLDNRVNLVLVKQRDGLVLTQSADSGLYPGDRVEPVLVSGGSGWPRGAVRKTASR